MVSAYRGETGFTVGSRQSVSQSVSQSIKFSPATRIVRTFKNVLVKIDTPLKTIEKLGTKVLYSCHKIEKSFIFVSSGCWHSISKNVPKAPKAYCPLISWDSTQSLWRSEARRRAGILG